MNNKFEDFKKYCSGKKAKGNPLFQKKETGMRKELVSSLENPLDMGTAKDSQRLELDGTATKNPERRQVPQSPSQEEVFPLSKFQLVTLLKNCQREKNALRYELDLLKLKLSHPDLTCQKIEELGEEFLSLLSKGISLEDAFSLSQKKRPKSLGPLKTDVKRQDYIPKDVAKKMSKKEIEENYDLIQNSMKHWG